MANLTFTNHHNVKLIASSTDLLVLQGEGDIRGAGERSLPSSTIYPVTNNKNIFANWFISAICAFFVITLPIFMIIIIMTIIVMITACYIIITWLLFAASCIVL